MCITTFGFGEVSFFGSDVDVSTLCVDGVPSGLFDGVPADVATGVFEADRLDLLDCVALEEFDFEDFFAGEGDVFLDEVRTFDVAGEDLSTVATVGFGVFTVAETVGFSMESTGTALVFFGDWGGGMT